MQRRLMVERLTDRHEVVARTQRFGAAGAQVMNAQQCFPTPVRQPSGTLHWLRMGAAHEDEYPFRGDCVPVRVRREPLSARWDDAAIS